MRADEDNMPDNPLEPREGGDEELAEFDQMMSGYLDTIEELEIGQITRARVVEVKKDYAMLDVGDKAEGIVDIKEFVDFRGNVNLAVGDEVEVVVQGRDSDTGHVLVSHRLAKRRAVWTRLVEAQERNFPVHGFVTKALKKGVLVDVGIPCFLPASHLDIVRTEDLSSFVGQEIEAYVIELDHERHRGVLSRKKVLVEEQKKKRAEVLETIAEDTTVTGKVKSIVDFGVFVDLGGIDGLVPREEVSWERHANPAELLKTGYNYKFKVIAVDRERERITLSRRQLKPDPWLKIEQDFAIDSNVKGVVTNLSANCAYVRLEDGIEGRIHRNNLSWALSVRKPSDVLKKDDTIKAMVIGYDKEKRLLDLSLKQITMDPWGEIESKYPVNSRVKVKVIEVVPYGAFVQIDDNTKGLIHVSDMSYERNFKNPKKVVNVGDEVEAVVLKIDLDARRINLGIKQLEDDPFELFLNAHPQGSVVTGKVKSITGFGAFIELAPKIEGLLHISQWGREKIDSLESVLKPGDEVTVKITKVERDIQKLSLSRRQYLADEERREVDKYKQNPTEATTRLGSLLENLKININR
jgi:small subunit ribosomal protein S1